jgi:hypothetical protein
VDHLIQAGHGHLGLSSTVDRIWSRHHPSVDNAYAFTEFAVDEGFMSLDFAIQASGIGKISNSVTISGIPNPTLREMDKYRKVAYRAGIGRVPVLEDLLISIHDDGGLDIIIGFLANMTRGAVIQKKPGSRQPESRRGAKADTKAMRLQLAESLTKKMQAHAETNDETTQAGYRAFRDFIVEGGALTISIRERVPFKDLGHRNGGKLRVTIPFIIRHAPPN